MSSHLNCCFLCVQLINAIDHDIVIQKHDKDALVKLHQELSAGLGSASSVLHALDEHTDKLYSFNGANVSHMIMKLCKD